MNRISNALRKRWLAIVPLLLALLVAPQPALADQDILLGDFFTSGTDWTNSIYASYDGYNLYRISTAYDGDTGANGQGYLGSHRSQMDPSIMYYNGKFWSLSGWNKNDGKISFMISYSDDLVNWTHPEGGFSGNGISISGSDPAAKELGGKFDIVAPEWTVGADGNPVIVVSCGYYGDWHGEATVDRMWTYVIHVDELTGEVGSHDQGKYYWPEGLSMKTGPAKLLSLDGGNNYIDGSIYVEGGTNYLVVKKNGMTNQVYSCGKDVYGNWGLVNGNMSYGFEGPSLVKFNGSYQLFGDHVVGATADGVQRATASSLKANFDNWAKPNFSADGRSMTARHGTVIVLHPGTDGYNLVKAKLDSKIPHGSSDLYRCYNPASGEHLYTTHKEEVDHLVSVGWNWEKDQTRSLPVTSGTPVWRVYNPATQDHHYTSDAYEYKVLTTQQGWVADFSGAPAFYSAGKDGKPFYRMRTDPYVTFGHLYSADANEKSTLFSRGGWVDEGIGWYAN